MEGNIVAVVVAGGLFIIEFFRLMAGLVDKTDKKSSRISEDFQKISKQNTRLKIIALKQQDTIADLKKELALYKRASAYYRKKYLAIVNTTPVKKADPPEGNQSPTSWPLK